MLIKKETKWIIMDRNRKVIAVGVPRNRQLVMLDGKSKARILTYNSKRLAENGFKKVGFYNRASNYFEETYKQDNDKWGYGSYKEYLEAVPVEVTIKEVEI